MREVNDKWIISAMWSQWRMICFSTMDSCSISTILYCLKNNTKLEGIKDLLYQIFTLHVHFFYLELYKIVIKNRKYLVKAAFILRKWWVGESRTNDWKLVIIEEILMLWFLQATLRLQEKEWRWGHPELHEKWQ